MSFDLFDETVPPGPLHILTVCTGNVCRSPLVEVLLRQVLRGLPVSVTSAGTAALVGDAMTPQNQRIADELGIADGASHRARQVTRDMLEAADLVLALTREHRRAVVELCPRAAKKAFTLREFARLADAEESMFFVEESGDAGAAMRAAITEIAGRRGVVPPPRSVADDDVVDPYRQSDDVYAASREQIVPAVNSTARALRRAVSSQGS
ncbi:arsenate reductase/protein-tyrosine-phosphatase family protein [Leucobacter sp. USHLN154]|uniref:arsenate reductase/protein-tyrosine-phosphatase family protein n=1 Tax=Leucobacter sp. USHLN154 TaxID=3081269 RepID=UPI003015A168